MLNVSKVARLQSAPLLKMNYFTGSFKLSQWLHSYHRISYPIIPIILRLWLRGNTSTLHFCSWLHIHHICTVRGNTSTLHFCSWLHIHHICTIRGNTSTLHFYSWLHIHHICTISGNTSTLHFCSWLHIHHIYSIQ